MSAVAGWENFYVIVGSSAGALIGLQFVVMTLIATRPIGPGRSQEPTRSQRQRLFTSEPCCCFRQSPALRGRHSSVLQFLIGFLAFSGCFTSSSLFAACAHRMYTSPSSRTGSFTRYSPLGPTRR